MRLTTLVTKLTVSVVTKFATDLLSMQICDKPKIDTPIVLTLSQIVSFVHVAVFIVTKSLLLNDHSMDTLLE